MWPQVLIDSDENFNFLIIKFLSIMEKLLYIFSYLIIVLTKGSIKYIEKKGGKNIIYLPNGPDLDKFTYKDLPHETKSFNNKRKFLLLYCGAHGKVNGLMNVIKAAELIKDHKIEIHLIGDGPEKINLINASKKIKNVKFFDPIPKNQMPNLLAKYDAVLLSLSKVTLFRYGVSPNKLYDAYAVGRPVIATVPGEINKEIKTLSW